MRTILAHATGGKFPTTPGAVDVMKNIGFLNFGHWSTSPQSQVQTASDALLQSIDLALADEEVGADGAYLERKGVGEGKRVSVRVDSGGRRIIKKKKKDN